MKKLNVLGLVISLMVLLGCELEHLKISESDIVEGIEGNSLDFSKVFYNDWDKIYIFHPYTPIELIEETIGVNFSYTTAIEYSDAIYLVIAIKNGQVIKYAEVSRLDFDFNTNHIIMLTKDNPIFIFDEEVVN